ncbi:MAG: T9SS type A sorting domain-containing protein [Saprospiraceae bacterium]|nr:T9SS type A sorting domain-containing protein [Candidatus Defluviibacterium haderslevense]
MNYLLSSNSQYIDLPSLPSGIYLINVVTDNNKFHSEKMVIMN